MIMPILLAVWPFHFTRKASVKQSGFVKEIRESFARLDLEHRDKHRRCKKQGQDQEQERPEVVPTACNAYSGEDGDGDGDEEEGGRARSIDVETSMSVR